MSFWLNDDGQFIIGDDGKVQVCDDCPCGECPAQIMLNLSGVDASADKFCWRANTGHGNPYYYHKLEMLYVDGTYAIPLYREDASTFVGCTFLHSLGAPNTNTYPNPEANGFGLWQTAGPAPNGIYVNPEPCLHAPPVAEGDSHYFSVNANINNNTGQVLQVRVDMTMMHYVDSYDVVHSVSFCPFYYYYFHNYDPDNPTPKYYLGEQVPNHSTLRRRYYGSIGGHATLELP